jgi:glycosyltransferase involved in cell wall biosynthesis
VTLSILIPSCGRPSLTVTLASATEQMLPGDELLVDVNDDGDWGNSARNRMMAKATGDYLLFMDDDDVYDHGALSAVRAVLTPQPKLHLFRMRYADGRSTLWVDREIRDGNVSTQMLAAPNRPDLPAWGGEYAADLGFIQAARELLGEPVWHDQVISIIRP